MSHNDVSTQELSQHVKISLSDLACITSNIRSLTFSTGAIEIEPNGVAQVGNVVLCEVVSIGAHEKLEDRSGRFVGITPGDTIMGVMGNRQSTVSMYGGLPDSGISLPRKETVDLLSSGGLIGECYSSPSYLGSPTKLRLLGLASQEENLIKITPRYRDKQLQISCPLILITGTSANVGKTRFASKLIHYLVRNLGRHVAATKLAGAGNLDDLLSLRDNGAKPTFDFVDAGLVSTYGNISDQVVEVAKGVLNHLGKAKPDVIIAELGGDIIGANVPAILADPEIFAATSTIILVPSDIFAASGALSYLREKGVRRNINVAQPLKNPAISQKRAKRILHCRIFDCEKTEDLSRLVERIDKGVCEKDNAGQHVKEPKVLQIATSSRTALPV
jgi:hypothetical protein